MLNIYERWDIIWKYYRIKWIMYKNMFLSVIKLIFFNQLSVPFLPLMWCNRIGGRKALWIVWKKTWLNQYTLFYKLLKIWKLTRPNPSTKNGAPNRLWKFCAVKVPSNLYIFTEWNETNQGILFSIQLITSWYCLLHWIWTKMKSPRRILNI
jgi:hypothetical protein